MSTQTGKYRKPVPSSLLSSIARGRHLTNALRLSIASCVIVALLSSLTGLWNDFASDDVTLIGNDQRIHSLGNWSLFFTKTYWPPPWSPELYRPLSTTWYAIEWFFGGGSPIAFRVGSYVLYAATAVGVLLLARRFLPSFPAWAVAVLFAAHPVHVEAVALGVNQSELIVTGICLLMVMRYVDVRRRGTLDLRDWAVLCSAYLAASLFKETGLIIPGILLAAEFTVLATERGDGKRNTLIPGYVALGLLGLLVLWLRSRIIPSGVVGTFTAEALVGLDAYHRALTMLGVVGQWFRLLGWPAHLQIDYSPHEIVAATSVGLSQLLGFTLLLCAAFAAIALRRRIPLASFGIAWCGIALFPVSNVLVPTGIVLAERTLLLPSVGFLLCVCALLTNVLQTESVGWQARRAVAAGCAALVIAGTIRSAVRERDWRNNWVLWYRTAMDAPLSYRAQHAFGSVLFQIGQTDLAIAAYERAISYSPKPQYIRNELADQLRDRGNDSLALPQLERSLVEDPGQSVAKSGLIADLIALGRYGDAKREAVDAARRGMAVPVAQGLYAVADSAEQAHAPAGSVRLHVRTAPVQATFGP